ncbi:MAG TPA: nucleotide exchange factor GrpE [Woeseiaceae bacterium]
MSGNPDSSDDQQYERAANGTDKAAAEAGTAGESTAGSDTAALQALADENWDKYLRTAAELENMRKRAARDMENARKFALERFATELLAVRDSLEMGLQAAEGMNAADLIEGSKATLKQLVATMERFGVTEVDPQGEPFDPALHEAMTMQQSDQVEPNTVLTVFQKGYTLNGRLLRPARVVVASAP